MTIVQKLTLLLDEIGEERGNSKGDAAREFSIAITAIEDAVMRVNRGFAIRDRTFRITDVQADIRKRTQPKEAE